MIKPEIFASAAQSCGRLSLSELLGLHGPASPAVLLLVLSVLCVLPVFGVGTALSFAIFAMAWRWGALTRGGTSLGNGLSDRLGQLSLSETWSRRCLQGLAWMFRDGLALLASALVGSGAAAFTVAFGHLVWEAFLTVRTWLGLGLGV